VNDVPNFAPPRDLRKDGSMSVSYGMDDNMLVTFFEEPLYMEFMSKQVGHPVFQNRIMTRIVQPGNNKTVWVHQTKGIKYDMVFDPASGEYHTDWEEMEVCENGEVPEHLKYANAWKRFMRQGVSADTGVPVEEWGAITKSYAMSLKAMHVHTVEALAGLSDQAAQSIMGAIKYRDLAKAYLDEREKTRIVAREQEKATRAEEENVDLKRQIENLRQHVLTLQSQLNQRPGGQPLTPAMTSQEVGAQLATYNETERGRQMSVKDAKRKHKIPLDDKAA
jgi:hypothetical protein